MQALEPVRDHVVQTRQRSNEPLPTAVLGGAQQSDARGIRIGIPKDAEYIHLAQMCNRHRERLDRRPHTHHNYLPARFRRVE